MTAPTTDWTRASSRDIRVTSAPDRPISRRTARRLSRLRAPRTAALEASPTMAGTSMAQAKMDMLRYCDAMKSKP